MTATQPATLEEVLRAMTEDNRKWLRPGPIPPPPRIPLNVIQLAVRQDQHPEVKRPCGECNVCCTVLGVGDLKKPHWTKCVHEVPGGCRIYGSHPPDCAEFDCLWKIGWGDPVRDRPDRSGVFLNLDGGSSDAAGVVQVGMNIRVHEVRPGAIDERFPAGPDVSIVALVGGLPGIGVVLIRHGVPTAYDGEVGPLYKVDPPRPVGSTLTQTVNNITSVQIGVQAGDVVHTMYGPVPAE